MRNNIGAKKISTRKIPSKYPAPLSEIGWIVISFVYPRIISTKAVLQYSSPEPCLFRKVRFSDRFSTRDPAAGGAVLALGRERIRIIIRAYIIRHNKPYYACGRYLTIVEETGGKKKNRLRICFTSIYRFCQSARKRRLIITIIMRTIFIRAHPLIHTHVHNKYHNTHRSLCLPVRVRFCIRARIRRTDIKRTHIVI